MYLKIFYYAVFIILIISFIYGGYLVNRWFNYTFGYESLVKEEICSMVKSEYLIEPNKCK